MVVEKRNLPLFELALSALDYIYAMLFTLATLPLVLLESGGYFFLALLVGLAALLLL